MRRIHVQGAILATIVGCGSSAKVVDRGDEVRNREDTVATLPPQSSQATPSTAAPPVLPREVRFTVSALEITERAPRPRALTRLEWPVDVPDRALAAQRRRVERAAKSALEREQLTLATMLWAGDNATDATRTEARQLLRSLVKQGSPTESTLVMLSIAELTLGDASGGRAALDELILRFPRSKRHWGYRAARASLDLEAGDFTKAAQIINGADLESNQTPPEVFYVAGWLEYRAGDYRDAFKLLSMAAANWADLDTWDYLRDELYRSVAMAGVSADDATGLVDSLLAGVPKREGGTRTSRIRTTVSGGKRIVITRQNDVEYNKPSELAQLASAYLRTGDLETAQGLLREPLAASDFPGATAVAATLASSILDAQGKPEEAAEKLVDAWSALLTAQDQYEDTALTTLANEIIAEGPALAADYAAIYRHTGDVAYARAGAALYAWLATNSDYDGQDDAALRETELADSAMITTPVTGYSAALARALARRTRLSLRPCYARVLPTSPDIAGTLTVEMAIDGSDRAITVSPEPAETGLGAVSKCVLAAARSWWFPVGPEEQRVIVEIPIRYRIEQTL